ncbi:MAG: 50S ribosomal protein L1 [Candidatus Aenigmarchaeota archaeon]|nr:50S ribosomal protein L1 [Candidatus Aenigmarchaeota archaeon]
MKVEEAIKEIRSQPKKNFVQGVELNVVLKNIDPKRPEQRFSRDVALPHGRGRDVKVGIISDKLPDAITKGDLESMVNDTKKMRATLKEYRYFLCDPPLMATVGKVLGKYLGPKGRMPKPILPTMSVEKMMESFTKSVTLRMQESVSLNVPVGIESMEDAKLADNVNAVLNELKTALPKGANQIKRVLLKTTMGKPVIVDA